MENNYKYFTSAHGLAEKEISERVVKAVKVLDIVEDFFYKDPGVRCAESIFQMDRVQEASYDLLVSLGDIVGYIEEYDDVEKD
jgi:aspartokinase